MSGNVENTVKIVQITMQGRCLNSLEKYHICCIQVYQQNKQINKTKSANNNPIFDIIYKHPGVHYIPIHINTTTSNSTVHHSTHNKMFWEVLLTYIGVCIHCHGNVFTGFLPSPSNRVRGDTQIAEWSLKPPFIFSK
jgi:hypothetical protein